ncbi:hypothetical protein ABN235_19075 [Morganella morganii]|uniref:hypothetical protein n=1 Tax=Morganella morganii TaxID=582 RepID=UPI0032D9B099
MGERSDGCSIPFTVGEFFAAELRLSGDDAPDLNDSNDDEDEEENEEEEAAQEQGSIPMDWTSTQRQLHEEQMNY